MDLKDLLKAMARSVMFQYVPWATVRNISWAMRELRAGPWPGNASELGIQLRDDQLQWRRILRAGAILLVVVLSIFGQVLTLQFRFALNYWPFCLSLPCAGHYKSEPVPDMISEGCWLNSVTSPRHGVSWNSWNNIQFHHEVWHWHPQRFVC